MIDTIGSQQSIIGAILLDPDTLLKVTDIITPEDMNNQYGTILAHALRLYADGEVIDISSLGYALQESKELERIGGMGCLLACASTPTAANALYHARIIKKESLKNRIKSWGKLVASRDYEDEESESLGLLERELLDIADNVKPKKSPEIGHILDSIEDRQEKIDQAMETGERHEFWVPSEFWGKAIPGYYKGHFWLVTGYTSFGKSTLLSGIIVDVCRNGGKPLVFSLEDSREEKGMSLRGVLSDIPKSWQLSGEIYQHRDALRQANETLMGWKPIIYDDVRTLDDMRLKAKKHVIKDGVNVVAIDYAQMIKGDGKIYDRMSNAAGYLQGMFKELGVTGIVLSQIDNQSAREGGRLIAAKGGGDLPAAADIVIDIDRKEDDRAVDLKIKKNRPFGKTGVRHCRFTNNWTAIEYDQMRGEK